VPGLVGQGEEDLVGQGRHRDLGSVSKPAR
jgi:hypothetical protein